MYSPERNPHGWYGLCRALCKKLLRRKEGGTGEDGGGMEKISETGAGKLPAKYDKKKKSCSCM